MLRENTAKLIALNPELCEWTNWDTLPKVYKDELFYPLADQIHKEYMDWFRQEVEKLDVISEELISEEIQKKTKKWSICNPAFIEDIIHIAVEAQLQHDKDRLLKEGR